MISLSSLPVRIAPALLALVSASAADLARGIDALTKASPAGGFAGIHVVQVATGKTLYARNDDRLFLPASNLKILTSALALERLGPDYRFTTRVVREVAGDVVLIGSGDPSLSGRAFPYQKDARTGSALAAIEELADQITAHGIHRIDGDIVGDDRLFPWDPYPPSWTQDDAVRDYGAAVSALTLNDNTVTVSIAAGPRAGDPATLLLSPLLEYLTFDNRVVTTTRRSEANVRLQRVPASREWLVMGNIPAGHAAIAEAIPVDDPSLFAATALYDALARRGVAIRGRPSVRHRFSGEGYPAVEGEEIASRVSPPLAELLQVMAKVSQNLHAELMLRAAGHAGTTDAGLTELQAYLTEIGVTPGDWRLEDGSGLSRNALLTPRLLTHVLVHMAQSKDREAWIALLPAGGEDGTLSNRLCCMSRTGLGVRAKTGSLARALALSGYADSATFGQVAFSILVNNFVAPAGEVRLWIDKIATLLLE